MKKALALVQLIFNKIMYVTKVKHYNTVAKTTITYAETLTLNRKMGLDEILKEVKKNCEKNRGARTRRSIQVTNDKSNRKIIKCNDGHEEKSIDIHWAPDEIYKPKGDLLETF